MTAQQFIHINSEIIGKASKEIIDNNIVTANQFDMIIQELSMATIIILNKYKFK